jgi:hypothetical protein
VREEVEMAYIGLRVNRIMLKWVSKKYVFTFRARFLSPREGSNGGLVWIL